MSGPSSLKPLVCEEVFDDRSQPSEEEIREYAVRIGIDPDGESHLLPLAKEGLLKPLPKNWKPVYDPQTKRYYYFNFKTKQSSWEHPLDNKFRDLVRKSRSESLSSAGEEDSKTSIKEELKSFEEAAGSGLDVDTTASTKESLMEFSNDGVPVLKSALSPLRLLKKDQLESIPNAMGKSKISLGKSEPKPILNSKPLLSSSSGGSKMLNIARTQGLSSASDEPQTYLDDNHVNYGSSAKQLINSRTVRGVKPLSTTSHDVSLESPTSSVIGRFTVDSVRKIDIDFQAKRLDVEGHNIQQAPPDHHLKNVPNPSEFTLSGGGSVFLKSNKRQKEAGEEQAINESLADSKSLGEVDVVLPGLSKRNMKAVLPQPITSSEIASASSTRSILRTPYGEKRLWEVDPQRMSVTEKALWKQQELEEEKKSVRFNLDKEINISFNLSDSQSDDSLEEGHVDEHENLEWNFMESEDLDLPSNFRKINPPLQKEKQIGLMAQETLLSKMCESEGVLQGGGSDSEIVSFNSQSAESKLDNKSELLKSVSYPTAILKGADICDIERDVLEVYGSVEGDSTTQSIQQIQKSLPDEHVGDMENISAIVHFSPGLENASDDTNPVVSMTKKSTNIVKRDNSAGNAQARKRAFRDWNVKHDDDDMFRPPMSRQQSQQQLLQMKQSILESSEDQKRDRALLEWNVTGSTNEAESHPPNNKNERNILTQGCSPDRGKMHSQSNSFESECAPEDFETKLEQTLERLKLEYEIKLKQREGELKLKFNEEQKEICEVFEDKLKQKVEEESQNLEKKFQDIVSQLEQDADARMRHLREQLEHKQNCAAQKILEQHQLTLAAQEVENQAAMLRIREQHAAELKALRDQFQKEEEQVRRDHQDRLVSLREEKDGKRSKEITDYLRTIEKLRCEKRLVEDKYRTLKEKYIKLKGEVKATAEKKEPKVKDNLQIGEKARQNEITGKDHEVSISHAQQQCEKSSEVDSHFKTMSTPSHSVGFQHFQSNAPDHVNSVLDPPSPAPNSELCNSNCGQNDSSDPFLGIRFSDLQVNSKNSNSKRNGIFSSPQYRNVSHSGALERNGNITIASQDNPQKISKLKEKTEDSSPLETLRHQLRTLDELEEQIPASSVTDAYMRYPFTDSGLKKVESAELEFFRHRIHLERDMISQANHTLQTQQSEFQSRMLKFQQEQSCSSSTPRATLYQMAKEEQELSDMEAKLQRTRTILSEKMLHLRHLENSLNCLSIPIMQADMNSQNLNRSSDKKYTEKSRGNCHRRWDWKSIGGILGAEDLNDEISSDSGGSSGFSSTEYASDGAFVSLMNHCGSTQRFKKSAENTVDLNASLQNLNAEISEIWNVLCKQRAAAGLGPPPLLNSQSTALMNPSSKHMIAPRSASPITTPLHKVGYTVVNSISEKHHNLMERTNNLRQWLQKAKLSANASSRDKD